MGFCYAINWKGNEVLSCDFCGGFKEDSKGTLSVRKIRCPFEYCQAYATCNNCRSKNNKELHIKNKCDIYAKEYELREMQKGNLLNNGLFVRTSAIARNETESF